MKVFNGKITKIGIWELTEEQKNKVFSNGKQYSKDKTHRVALICEGIEGWFNVGSIKCNPDYAPTWRREIDGNWEDLREGAEVFFQYTEEGKYKNIKLKSFNVIKNGDGKATPFPNDEKNSNNNQTQKKDFSGISTGHAINCSLWCTKHDISNITKILELSKNLHDLTVKLQKEYKKYKKDMSEYDVNAMVGHAILNACRIGGEINTIEQNARLILNDIVPPVSEYIKTGKSPVPSFGLPFEPDAAEDDETIPF